MLNIEPEQQLKQPEQSAGKVVHVCVAVIQRDCVETGVKQVFIAKRPDHLHQGGLWEFPGGKVEAGETILQALDRELHEELGINLVLSVPGSEADPQSISPLIQIQHDYPDKTVLLDVWNVHSFFGEPHGKEGQEVRWVSLDALNDYTFPEANLPIISACLLPNRYFITPTYESVLEAEQNLQLAITAGARLIYFRQPQLDEETYVDWVRLLVSKRAVFSQTLMLRHVSAQENLVCAGVHLPFSVACLLKTRPIPESQWFAVSCHNETELQHAKKIGADFVTLSPVLPTQTHPDVESLGWSRFQAMVRKAALPVFGLGGLADEHQVRLHESGAQGLAGIRFWQ